MEETKMKAIINGKEYELRKNFPYSYVDTLTLFIVSDSADEIVETIGDSATVNIPDEYTGKDLVLDYLTRLWDTGVSICEVVFKKYPVEETVKEQAANIEMIEQAVIELAEIIGGEE